jgi:hypothetical protein
MTQAWVTLTSVDGRDIAAPTEKQLAAVLAELYARQKSRQARPNRPARPALRL